MRSGTQPITSLFHAPVDALPRPSRSGVLTPRSGFKTPEYLALLYPHISVAHPHLPWRLTTCPATGHWLPARVVLADWRFACAIVDCSKPPVGLALESGRPARGNLASQIRVMLWRRMLVQVPSVLLDLEMVKRTTGGVRRRLATLFATGTEFLRRPAARVPWQGVPSGAACVRAWRSTVSLKSTLSPCASAS